MAKPLSLELKIPPPLVGAFVAALISKLIFVAYITRFQIEPEERVMMTKFGEEFSSYAARVRRWL
jgi:protein-S-isoprenylcysteine O-methyltransferase Ste14